MVGKMVEEVRVEGNVFEELVFYKVFMGNCFIMSIFVGGVIGFVELGVLIVYYEYFIFIEGVVWDINFFDQWGVELGKVLVKKILKEIDEEGVGLGYDFSIGGLLGVFKVYGGF